MPILSHSVLFRRVLRLFPLAVIDRCDRTAFPRNFRCDALRDFACGAIVYQNVEFRLPLYVNETRRGNKARSINALSRGRLPEVADGLDAIARYPDICGEPGRARAVDDPDARNHEVVAWVLRENDSGKKQKRRAG